GGALASAFSMLAMNSASFEGPPFFALPALPVGAAALAEAGNGALDTAVTGAISSITAPDFSPAAGVARASAFAGRSRGAGGGTAAAAGVPSVGMVRTFGG